MSGPGNVRNAWARRYPLAGIALAAVALAALFLAVLLPVRRQMAVELRRGLVERDAAVLHPVLMLRWMELRESGVQESAAIVGAVVRSARQRGMLAAAVYDAEGGLVRAIPAGARLTPLPPDDFFELEAGKDVLTRLHPAAPAIALALFAADRVAPTPVLEVVLAMRESQRSPIVGVAHFWLDARSLETEVTALEARLTAGTWTTGAAGLVLLGAVTAAMMWSVARARQEIAERSRRLEQANLELSFAARASAVGQISAHLLHALQGPLTGMRAVMQSRALENGNGADWQEVADHTRRLERMVQETVAFLRHGGESRRYGLSAAELGDMIKEDLQAAATARGVVLRFDAGSSGQVDGYRGGLIHLIAKNLIENAVRACTSGAAVTVTISIGAEAVLEVRDEGHGVAPTVQSRLFEAGASTKTEGSGLGLAISRMLARYLGGDLTLIATDCRGSCFRLLVPLDGLRDKTLIEK